MYLGIFNHSFNLNYIVFLQLEGRNFRISQKGVYYNYYMSKLTRLNYEVL